MVSEPDFWLEISKYLDYDHVMRLKCLSKVTAALAFGIALVMSGCANTMCCFTTTQETEDSIQYVVIGVGVISIPKSKSDGIVATNMKAAGLVATNQPGLKVGLGYSSSSVVAIPPSIGNAIVEVRTCEDTNGIAVTAKSNEGQ